MPESTPQNRLAEKITINKLPGGSSLFSVWLADHQACVTANRTPCRFLFRNRPFWQNRLETCQRWPEIKRNLHVLHANPPSPTAALTGRKRADESGRNRGIETTGSLILHARTRITSNPSHPHAPPHSLREVSDTACSQTGATGIHGSASCSCCSKRPKTGPTQTAGSRELLQCM